jgi:hypothetical protein
LFLVELGSAEPSFSAGLRWPDPATFFPLPIRRPLAWLRNDSAGHPTRSDGKNLNWISSSAIVVRYQQALGSLSIPKEIDNKNYG